MSAPMKETLWRNAMFGPSRDWNLVLGASLDVGCWRLDVFHASPEFNGANSKIPCPSLQARLQARSEARTACRKSEPTASIFAAHGADFGFCARLEPL